MGAASRSTGEGVIADGHATGTIVDNEEFTP
jgi:hypothetical protein